MHLKCAYCGDTTEGTPTPKQFKNGRPTRPLLCKFHLNQWKFGAQLAPRQRVRQVGKRCTGPKCLRPAKTQLLCMGHYRQKFMGQPLRPLKRPTGRMLTSQGYVVLRLPNHPMASKAGWVLEHRKVMADHIGRNLLPDETVHHKNGKRGDNRIENLELWTGKHPATQRVDDLVEYAVEVLQLYAPQKLAA